jgi:hypothetical protein
MWLLASDTTSKPAFARPSAAFGFVLKANSLFSSFIPFVESGPSRLQKVKSAPAKITLVISKG